MPIYSTSKIAITTAAIALIVPALLRFRKVRRPGAITDIAPKTLPWSRLSSLFFSQLPKDLTHWTVSNEFNSELLRAEVAACRKAWDYLEPIFASHGYTFYKLFTPSGSLLIANPSGPEVQATSLPTHPYARRVYDKDIQMLFSTTSMQIWPARDSLGREVVIKVIADDTNTEEYEIFKILNTAEMRSDPRNHTIPIIEFIRVEKYTFVVMPRWYGGLWLDFGVVNELMWFAQSMLEVFDFLHEHRIVHFDFLEQNLGINVLSDVNQPYITGLLDPSVTKYALFDFGHSKQYPLDCDINEVEETRFFGFDLRGMHEPEGPYNPFQVEMYSVGLVLQINIRHVEHVVPELGPFFDAMLEDSPAKRLTARQALHAFQKIYESLSDEQLHAKVDMLLWEHGKITPKRTAMS
ncbi:hypothetical protein HYPSUDRAFT_44512 [Hypholoma sublateritium FD-334 SS-4]|uniref:Protein kinase domain-containing protein n=1 Tax=Hypholoma sublateritium (strain FD-334 SS-4) TaxID=945553 RepID=A0A0D2PGN1_HYPSF|nr:hypothetical protein HYPSUDRAFT_44512 [Hypholoma sublateritium FD-334 SS-4]